MASTTLTGPLEWNSTLIKGNVVDEVQRLKSELDGDLIISGAGAFARFLVESGLVDEVWFWVHPTIQGPRRPAVPCGPQSTWSCLARAASTQG